LALRKPQKTKKIHQFAKKSPKKITGWDQSGEGIKNCTKPCWVSKLMIIMKKKFK
jgi:hypothetical protein